MKKILSIFAIVVSVLAAYLPALRNDFVWDDTALILRDPLIRSWRLIPEGFRHFLFTDATASDFYRPIQRLTYVLDYEVFAFRSAGYHLTSILYHLAAALALLLLAGELLGLFGVEERNRRRIAFLASLAWAIHPVHTAAVVYVSGRADPLAAAFGFLGLYLGIRSFRANDLHRWLLFFAAGALFLFSALSKETGIIFLILWCALLLLKKQWKDFRSATVVVILLVTGCYLGLRLSAEHFPAPRFRPLAPLLDRPFIAARAFAEYAGLVLLPINLHMDRDVEVRVKEGVESPGPKAGARKVQTLLGVVLIGGTLFWLTRSRKQSPATHCCLTLAAITYLPISGILPLNATVAEHWIYLPTAFLFLAVGLAISKFPISTVVIGPILAVWLLFLGTRTWIRTLDWRDQRTFLERTLASGGDSVRMLINLAGLELKEGRLDIARNQLERALKIEPDQPFAVLNLAAVAIQQNDFSNAHQLLDRAMQVPFTRAKANELLAVLDLRETGLVNAMRFQRAARTPPADWSIERRYVQALDQSGSTRDAINELRSCLVNQWYRAESWQFLSELLTKEGQPREAAEALDRAKAYDVHLGEHQSP